MNFKTGLIVQKLEKNRYYIKILAIVILERR